uniref:Phosphatidate cytidylyltransferase n=1 Tax=candidate division WOR-3 bacterium TaxID=2052148 RepID=A0A7C6EED7_UNCW3
MVIPILYYIIPSQTVSVIILVLVTIIFLTIDFLRLHLNPIKGVFIILFGSLLRRREFSSLTGGSYLLLASLVTLLIFNDTPGVFIAAISFLAIGDTTAAIVGLSIGRIKVFRKSLEGTLAGLASCIIVAYIVSILPDKSLPFRVAVWGGVAAALVEALPIEVNDNVVIPILSATVMQLVKALSA